MAHAALDAALATLDAATGGVPRRLLVGLSGGLDSTVLLHALARRGGAARLRAVHVHHGLHVDADRWTAQCQRLCDALGVELVVARIRVDRASPLGPEAAAREARYEAFAEALRPGEDLVLAHHRDDQAETVLLRLLRASGSAGAAGMRASRGFHGARLLRPLLGLPRSQLLAYAQRHALAWCEDPSNAREDADRNFLRLRVLPLLRERWPQADAAIAGSAARLADDADLLQEAVEARLQELGGGDDWLPVEGLRALAPAWRAQVLRMWARRQGLPPLPGTAPERIAADVLDAAHDRAACYRWRGVELRRWGDRLYARPRADEPSDWPAVGWDGRQPLVLADGGVLDIDPAPVEDFDRAFGQFTVAPRRGGERIRLPGRQHAHALKDCLREAALKPWERARLPLLFAADGELLAAADVLVSARLRNWLDGHGARLRWQRPLAGRVGD
jgi:tRNA(Ile)-lysidine synthase